MKNLGGRPPRLYQWRHWKYPLVEWAEISGIPYHTLKNRLVEGWSLHDALVYLPGEVRHENRLQGVLRRAQVLGADEAAAERSSELASKRPDNPALAPHLPGELGHGRGSMRKAA